MVEERGACAEKCKCDKVWARGVLRIAMKGDLVLGSGECLVVLSEGDVGRVVME